MKIKLQDYSLISNELVEQLDSFLAHEEDYTHGELGITITEMRGKLQKLTPATKLAEKCFDEGKSIGVSNFQPTYCSFDEQLIKDIDEQLIKDKQTFLTSEIELAQL